MLFRSEIRPSLEKYVRGSNGVEALDRVKIMKLLWDALGSEFGSRHELYERNYSGSHEDARVQLLGGAAAMGILDMMEGMADQCMSEYDLDGWTSDKFLNPADVSAIGKFNF